MPVSSNVRPRNQPSITTMGRVIANMLPVALVVVVIMAIFDGDGAAAMIVFFLVAALILIVWFLAAGEKLGTKEKASSATQDGKIPLPSPSAKRPEQPIQSPPVEATRSNTNLSPAPHQGMIWTPDRSNASATDSRSGLVPCPACRQSVSMQARACPKCGHPLRRTEHRIVEVCHQGSSITNQAELDAALADGWQIVSEDDSETWTYRGDNGTVYCRMYKYSLVRY